MVGQKSHRKVLKLEKLLDNAAFKTHADSIHGERI